jgi:hypothetical protein
MSTSHDQSIRVLHTMNVEIIIGSRKKKESFVNTEMESRSGGEREEGEGAGEGAWQSK